MSEAFRPYFGGVDPVLALAIASLVGAMSLTYLRKRWSFPIGSTAGLPDLLRVAGIASAFALPVIVLDIFVGFPRGMNVAWPTAFLFYPSIAWFVEMALHVTPFATLLLLFGGLVDRIGEVRLAGACIVLVSLIEPVIQVVLAPPGEFPALATAYVALHVFAFGLAQFWTFRRFGFAPMLAFRLVYYLWWHIVWGHVRLQLLF